MRLQNIIYITEDISLPVDEGAKKFNYYLLKYLLNRKINLTLFTRPNNNPDISYKKISDRMFLSFSLMRNIRKIKPDLIFYVPLSSGTLLSFIRLFILKCYYPESRTVLVNMQRRDHKPLIKAIIKHISPDRIVTLSVTDSTLFRNMGMETIVIRAGVDTEQFKSAETVQKLLLRKKYGFDPRDKIALHIGHIRKSRNIELLKSLVCHDFKVLIAGSTSTPVDKMLKSDLEKSGIRIMDEYIPGIEEIYQLSDVYVFPVTGDHAAIEFPLSVLEAMSCNLPVVTTPYGSLKDNFAESEGFAYFSNEQDLIGKTRKMLGMNCRNRDLIIEIFSWECVFNQLIEKLEQL